MIVVLRGTLVLLLSLGSSIGASLGCSSSSSAPGASDAGAPRASVAALKAQVEAKLPALATQFSGSVPTSADAIYASLDRYLAENPDFFGCTLAVDPSRVAGGLAPYSYRVNPSTGALGHKDLARVSGYDYTSQDWYVRPKAAGAASWSDPYFDQGGGDINMVTYSLPITSGGSFLGILTTDVGVDDRPTN